MSRWNESWTSGLRQEILCPQKETKERATALNPLLLPLSTRDSRSVPARLKMLFLRTICFFFSHKSSWSLGVERKTNKINKEAGPSNSQMATLPLFSRGIESRGISYISPDFQGVRPGMAAASLYVWRRPIYHHLSELRTVEMRMLHNCLTVSGHGTIHIPP